LPFNYTQYDVLTYKMAIALRPQICDLSSPYVYYHDKVKQFCATWQIHWKFVTACSRTALIEIDDATRHGPAMGKYDVNHKTAST